jgi:hypothetical protein
MLKILPVLASPLVLLVPGCKSAKPVAPTAQFRGFLRLGPEQMSFQSCGTSRRDRWWWELDPRVGEVKGWKDAEAILDSQPRCDLDTLPCKLQEVYVEANGRLSESGRFGHLGVYGHQLWIGQVLFASRSSRPDCSQPD